jgi:hypothetical protein
MYARLGALLVAFALAVAGPALAQERFGTLTGQVTDQQNIPVPGVTVTFTNVQTGQPRTLVTDASGQYLAPDLTPGRYTVRFELQGFAPVERTDVNVLLGRAFQIDAQLRVGGLTEAKRPLSSIRAAPSSRTT